MVSFSIHVSCLVSLLAFASWTIGAADTLAQRLPWYHSSDVLHQKFQRLEKDCSGATFVLSQLAKDGVSIDVARISTPESNESRIKAVFFFGIHSRELISSESGLHFLETLCGKRGHSERVAKVLSQYSFTIVPNANMAGRKAVENGNFCKRTNDHGVDLNRNWGYEGHIGKHRPGQQTNAGPHVFSEVEAQLLKGLVEKEQPTVFLDVHSGSYLLGTPWGYSTTEVPDDESKLVEVLKPISDKYCNGECPYGNAASFVNYAAPGADMDYVKKKIGVPYTYTWEIYVGPSIRHRYTEKARQQRLTGVSFIEHNHHEEWLRTDLDQVHSHHTKSRTSKNEICLEQFNPLSKSETHDVVENWSGAYLELCEQVHAHMDRSTIAEAFSPQAALDQEEKRAGKNEDGTKANTAFVVLSLQNGNEEEVMKATGADEEEETKEEDDEQDGGEDAAAGERQEILEDLVKCGHKAETRYSEKARLRSKTQELRPDTAEHEEE